MLPPPAGYRTHCAIVQRLQDGLGAGAELECVVSGCRTVLLGRVLDSLHAAEKVYPETGIRGAECQDNGAHAGVGDPRHFALGVVIMDLGRQIAR